MRTLDVLLAASAAIYLVLAVGIAWRTRRRTPLLLAACCLVTSAWGVAGLLVPGSIGVAGSADLVRALAWFGFLFFLYHGAQLGQRLHEVGFALAGLAAAVLGAAAILGAPGSPVSEAILPLGIVARLLLAVAALLLIENLYLNLPEHARWHVALPSILLGGLAGFDILLCADMVLFHYPTPALEGGRTLAMILIAPLLAVAAARGQRWKGKVRLSRSAAFHSATLVLTGSVLMALGLAGEVFRHLSGNWGWLAEVTLAFSAMIGIALLLTSGSARSRFQRLFVEHFFAERYDYRRQWQACIRTLSGEADEELDDGSPPRMEQLGGLATRAIRAVVSVVDSPAGALFLREGGVGPFHWAGSLNLPATDAVPETHPVVVAVQGGAWVARLDGPHQSALISAPLDGLGPLWLAVPLVQRGVLNGLVLAASPRAPFALEQEVFDLLRIVAQEVATYIAEQRATQTLLQTRQLHDYSQRFAFVAHDIKNVSSQLGLVLTNAETHITNPEFQKDMLETVRSSVRKIASLLQRLERPEPDSAPGTLAPVPRLEGLIATYQRVRRSQILLEHDGSTGAVAMGAEAFEAAITHLLNNAVEAGTAIDGRPGRPVVVRVRHEARQVVIEVADQGPGMSPEFVRDALFRPFVTSKPGGSGIGAYQAREMTRAAGGDLGVVSEVGVGTTMRVVLPRTDARAAKPLVTSSAALSDAGHAAV
jgi:putative PEP-CTERM system histidine kinase